MSAQVTILQLPAAGAITGTEAVPVVQNGVTVQTTTGAIANSPTQTYSYLTVSQTPQLPNSRYVGATNGLVTTDGGAQGLFNISTTGALLSLVNSGTGIQVKTSSTAITGRSVASSGAGLSVTNGDGVSGNPTVALSGLPASLANLSGSGMVAVISGSGLTPRTITGTASQINLVNGDGQSGSPTISIADNVVLPGTSAMAVPSGTTGQLPVGFGGQIRYNTTTTRFQGFQNGNWNNFGQGDGTVTSVSGTSNQITVVNSSTTPQISIANNPQFPGSSNVLVPAGATGDRPITPANGMLRYSTTFQLFEGYINGAWQTIAAGSGVTSVATGIGLTGGPITSTGTISIANSGATAGTYGSSSQVPTFTVNAQGQVTSIANTSISATAIGAVTSVTGTANEIDSTGGQTPVLSLPSSLIFTSKTITGGAFNMASAQVVSDQVTTNNAAQTLTNKTISGGSNTLTNIANASLTNSSLTVGSTSIALGATASTLAGLTSVTVTQDPTTNFQLATKQYVDGLVASGIHFHAPVRVESPTPLNATYNQPGGAGVGVGATLTNAGTQAALVIDGVTLSVSDRVLIYTQTNATQNGVYVVTSVGSGSTNWVLTRSSDTNTYGIAGPTTLSEGSTFFVQQGTTGAGETYTCNTTGVIVFGVTNITFAQISSSQIYTGTSPINVTGTVISLTTVPVNLGGTNITSYTAGDLLYATGSTTLTKLPIGVAGRVLKSTGSAPDWQLNPTYLPVVLHSGSTVQISVASGFLPVLLHDGVTIVNVALF
jgi:hypothetical protein